MLGDASVGKSSIVQKWVRDVFTDSTESTLGVAFVAKNIVVEDTEIRLEIWDTAGQERYASLMPLYYRNADIALIVYDVENSASYQSAIKWLDILVTPVKILVGNKVDLILDDKSFMQSISSTLLDKNMYDVCPLFSSAKTGRGICEIFTTSCKIYLEHNTGSNITDLQKHINNLDKDEKSVDIFAFIKEKKRQLCC